MNVAGSVRGYYVVFDLCVTFFRSIVSSFLGRQVHVNDYIFWRTGIVGDIM